MRLIDADKFKEYITVSEDVLSLFKTEEFNQLVVSTMEAILRDIDAQPTIDAVEVVRCRYCKHLYEDDGCPLRYFKTHVEEDFCSYGERKDDG